MDIGTNNHVEKYALYFGLKLSLEIGIRSLIVVGNSLLVLSQTRRGKEILNQIFGCLHYHILSLLSHFHSLKYFHKRRVLNSMADVLANRASQLPRG